MGLKLYQFTMLDTEVEITGPTGSRLTVMVPEWGGKYEIDSEAVQVSSSGVLEFDEDSVFEMCAENLRDALFYEYNIHNCNVVPSGEYTLWLDE
jgi:hypothetical protein